jgi:hypothetical protein
MTRRRSSASVPDQETDAAELVRLALEVIEEEIRRKSPRGGAPAALAMIREPVFETKVAKALAYVQRMKSTDKGEWTELFRHGALSPRHRAVAAKIAAALSRLRAAIRPLEAAPPFGSLRWGLRYKESGAIIDFPMSTDEIEKWRSHFHSIADSKVRAGSRFDGRKLAPVRSAAALLGPLGLPLSLTRHGAFDQLSAILWGEPDADFSHYLTEYANLPERARLKRLEREAKRARASR